MDGASPAQLEKSNTGTVVIVDEETMMREMDTDTSESRDNEQGVRGVGTAPRRPFPLQGSVWPVKCTCPYCHETMVTRIARSMDWFRVWILFLVTWCVLYVVRNSQQVILVFIWWIILYNIPVRT